MLRIYGSSTKLNSNSIPIQRNHREEEASTNFERFARLDLRYSEHYDWDNNFRFFCDAETGKKFDCDGSEVFWNGSDWVSRYSIAD